MSHSSPNSSAEAQTQSQTASQTRDAGRWSSVQPIAPPVTGSPRELPLPFAKDDDPAVAIDMMALGPFQTNCYIVRPTGEAKSDAVSPPHCWIIDASWGAELLVEHARSMGLKPAALILTHAHVDHIAGVPDVRQEAPGIEVVIHRDEDAWLGDPVKNLSEDFGSPVTTPPADRILADGQAEELAGVAFQVLHTPGHSPGGITLYAPALGVAIVGDTLFNGSIGRHDFPTSDSEALMASIRERVYALPDDTLVLPGHGPTTTIGHEKRTNPFVRA